MTCGCALWPVKKTANSPPATRARFFPQRALRAREDRDEAQSARTHYPHMTDTIPATIGSNPVTAPAPAKPRKERKISKRLRQAVELLETGRARTQRQAAEQAGLSEEHLSRSLRKPQIQAFIARRRSENIARAALRASARMGDLLDSQSDHVALHASRLLLETSGDLKTGDRGVNVNIHNGISVGYVLDLTPREHQPAEPRIIDALAERDE